MKVFLFLYPIKQYFAPELRDHHLKDDPIKAMEDLNRIIERRYRQKGFRICWLLFSVENYPDVPDQSQIQRGVLISSQDLLIANGMDFKQFLSGCEYPSSSFILKKLPKNVSEIKIGGFHQNDCVDKVAMFLYQNGIDVLVDEDLTDAHYFDHVSSNAVIPDERVFTAEGFELFKDDLDGKLLEDCFFGRSERPWLVQ